MVEKIVHVPDLGGTDAVEVIELAVAPGDSVSEGQGLVVVESDKASMDIPAPFAGEVLEVLVTEGSEVAEGDPLVKLSVVDESAADKEAPASNAEPEKDPTLDESTAEQASTQEAAVQSVTAGAANTTEAITVPDLGGADSVEVIEICVAEGDTVAEGDSLLVLESDKASMDLPAPAAGTVQSISVAVGDSVAEGDTVFMLAIAGAPATASATTPTTSVPAARPDSSGSGSAASQKAAPVQAPASSATKSTAATAVSDGSVYAGPAVRKLARELGVDLGKVKGTGPKGRIAKQDLHDYVKEAVKQGRSAGGLSLPAMPAIDFAKFGDINTRPMTKMEKVTAQNMQRSWLTVPHVTHFDSADITDLEVFRKSLKKEMEQRGVKVSPVAFIVKAVAAALLAVPKFNTSIDSDGESIVEKNYVHIGMAVDTPNGLLVPVIRDVDKKGLWEIAADIIELAGKARDRKLKPQDMQGACFTISSLGAIGGTGFTPIVNTPEVGILGVSNSKVEPVFVDGEFVPRTMLPLALSYDHRVINGGDAGRFMTYLTACLADMRRVLL